MRLEIELEEEAEVVHMTIDDHLTLTAVKHSPHQISYQNFESLVDDPSYYVLKNIANSLLSLTNN